MCEVGITVIFVLIMQDGSMGTSVTIFGDLLDFGQPFKASGNNYFTQIVHIVRQFL